MKYIKYNRGFTLVEIIVSIAIIGILIVSILSFLPSNYKNIIRSGTRTKKVFGGQELMDKLIEGISIENNDFEVSKEENIAINIKFYDSDDNFKTDTGNINGTTISVKPKDNKMIFKTFIPLSEEVD